MKALLAIALITAAAIYLFGAFAVWATIVTVLAILGCIGLRLLVETNR